MISILLNALLLVAIDPAAAATVSGTATATAPAPTAEAPKKEREICKREPTSGSLHGSKRVCMTAKQWRARANGGFEDLSGVSTK